NGELGEEPSRSWRRLEPPVATRRGEKTKSPAQRGQVSCGEGSRAGDGPSAVTAPGSMRESCRGSSVGLDGLPGWDRPEALRTALRR
ncbi:hypothetical protein NDU88_008284, partial [Pleurodeles waltl]